ncbi:H-NS family nucleoid-associated regulatory protein [Caballeronia sp. SBC2]|uniref:H-NS family nucleoid-associated regulatory protein n=1 Tax=Caballeronia sp. SBC2 TaxID=2705547 RepID=UPI0013E1A8C1|nr:H-NS family nucleoid-associated regulatory protein [Caballeronia sp. SBC2]QIE22881.1 H-NS histone family protein [Caballeronia sp. SBC2]
MPTLEQIQTKMKKLQVQADALIAKKAQAAVDQIQKIMLAHGLTTEDIEAKAKAKRKAKAGSGSAFNVKPKTAGSLKSGTPPKYQHPKTGATWTGHGRAPAWIAEAKDRNKFLIAGGAEATIATTAGAVSKAKTAAKKAPKAGAGADAHRGQRTGPQPAKYIDPKTGATWSGKGPAPAWLAAAKDRSKFLIAGAAPGATETSTTSKASKPNSSAASGAVGKKATSTKVTAEKEVTEKSPAKKSPAKKAIAKKAVPSGKTTPAKKAAASKNANVSGQAPTVATDTESTT